MTTENTKPEAKAAEPNWDELRPQLTKLALELGPLVVFFVANARADIFAATAWFMGAMAVSLLLSWLLLRKIAVMPLVTGVVVLVFGGLTLWLQDDTFIKMKPTITNSLFAVVLLGGLLFKQSLLKYVFGEVYKLKPEGWTIMTLRWGLFFVVMAVLNELIWRNFSTDLWVSFKVWATMPITVVFTMFQLPLLQKYALEPEQPPKTA
ncbi:septation protein A [Paradevosia shaoguanensis]|uniref:Inner membrane-spanning protein YciB n=1 Tax=Paradevosia shaoguanensis TaxID=1335043 RepID=A0AA41QRR3_9HYPH|nr:septation protein A [Paradevosia shaoguanensis]MCF1744870.1 septation protein A [Paradevosia shaoguanensis]MCI0129353.1 septation protein A [Paradevosia shaoguanensis]CDP53833.1 Probable intracellular septation protein [Devosia sp. DBB001]